MNDIPKPKIGEPCNRCGLCCKIQVCLNGAYAMRLVEKLGETVKGACPALELDLNNQYRCGVVSRPKTYIKGNKYPENVLSRNFAHLIGANFGCDELGLDEDQSEETKLLLHTENLKNNQEWLKKTKIALKVVHGIEI